MVKYLEDGCPCYSQICVIKRCVIKELHCKCMNMKFKKLKISWSATRRLLISDQEISNKVAVHSFAGMALGENLNIKG